MWGRSLALCAVLARVAAGFAPSPIRWGTAPSHKFVVAPTPSSDLNMASVPLKLTIQDMSLKTAPHVIPHFTAKSDHTITWDAMGWCVEASGSQIGDVAQINHCTGGSNQRWSWFPMENKGMNQIQLKDTNKCLDVLLASERSGSPVGLRECGNSVPASWQFEGPTPALAQEQGTSSRLRHAMSVVSSFAMLVALSLGAWLWRRPHEARMPSTSWDGSPVLMEEGGVSLTDHIPAVFFVGLEGAQALLCDCDGTLVETERDGHRVAFNQAFKQVGIDCEWGVELYGDLLTTGGGKERMTRYFTDYNPDAWPHPEAPRKDHPAIMELHKIKTGLFMEIVESGKLPLRSGVKEMLSAAKKAGWTIAVCSTSNEKAVQAVVDTALPELGQKGDNIRVFAGDCVKAKKPDPAIYTLAAKELGLDPKKCVVVEDTNIGLLAGKAAGMSVVVTRSIYSEGEDFTGADYNVDSAADIDFENDIVPLTVAPPIESDPMFLNEATTLAAQNFPIDEATLIAKAKEFLFYGQGVEKPDLLDESFVFMGPFVGGADGLPKKDYVKIVGGFDIKVAFPDLDPRFHHFRADPLDPGRVWFTSQTSGTDSGSGFLGNKPTGKSFSTPPQACSVKFNEQGLAVKYTIGHVMERSMGNTGGLGGIFGPAYALGKPLPFPEANPWKPSKRYRFLMAIGNFLSWLQKRKEARGQN